MTLELGQVYLQAAPVLGANVRLGAEEWSVGAENKERRRADAAAVVLGLERARVRIENAAVLLACPEIGSGEIIAGRDGARDVEIDCVRVAAQPALPIGRIAASQKNQRPWCGPHSLEGKCGT